MTSRIEDRSTGNLGRFKTPPVPTHIAGNIYHYDPSSAKATWTEGGGAFLPPELLQGQKLGLSVELMIPKGGNAVATAEVNKRSRTLEVYVDVMNRGLIRNTGSEKKTLDNIEIDGNLSPFGNWKLVVMSAQTGDVLFKGEFSNIPRPAVNPGGHGNVRSPEGAIG